MRCGEIKQITKVGNTKRVCNCKKLVREGPYWNWLTNGYITGISEGYSPLNKEETSRYLQMSEAVSYGPIVRKAFNSEWGVEVGRIYIVYMSSG